MTRSHPFPALPLNCRRTTLRAWMIFLTLLALLGGVARLVEQDRRRELAGWYEVRQQLYELKAAIGVYDRATYDRIAARFTPGSPPATQPHVEGTSFRATFPGRSFGPEF